MCDDRHVERQGGGGSQSLLDIVSETTPRPSSRTCKIESF